MAGKSARQAIEEFVDLINETLGCVTDNRLFPYQESANIYKLLFRSPIAVTSSNGNRFYLQVTQVCTAQELEDGTFKPHTREYSYVFSDSAVPGHHGIVSYHWHPHDFDLRTPHLHLRITPELGYPEIERKIARAHYPTSRVCLEDFIKLLIDYYDIKPANTHWRRILRKNKTAFVKQATWSIAP